jgi:hypothetical protein
MKALRYSILILLCGCIFSCKKSDTTPSSAMSATINGSPVTFTPTFTNTNGVSVLQGTSNTYSIQIYLQVSGPGIQYFQSAPSYPYATVTDITGSYSTNGANQNEISLSAGTSSGLYNGSFSFTGTGGAGSISVSGQFTNM